MTVSNALLILNAGSSSLKFSAFRDAEPPVLVLRGQLSALASEPRFEARDAAGAIVAEREWPAGAALTHAAALELLLDRGRRGGLDGLEFVAVGHRIVHGGARFAGPALVDDDVLAEIEALVPLAPLHQPHGAAAIRAVAAHAPGLPQVACFDTSFHHGQPAVARAFALPRKLAASGVRRYGFHGLSYEHIAGRLPGIDARAARGRTVIAHLGNGASLCALLGGASVATTMGLTPLDGLPMGTRCGAIDPGALIYLMRERGMDADALERLLTYESGLLGVSGVSSDMRELLEREESDPRAAEAIELFVYRTSREIGSMAAAVGGLDALVFTGGIGEHAVSIRARVCRAAAWLGIDLDDAANDRGGPRISLASSRIAAWVVPTDEELMIARHTRKVIHEDRQ